MNPYWQSSAHQSILATMWEWEWASALGLWLSPSKGPSLWLCALGGLLLLTASPCHRLAWRALYAFPLLVSGQALLFAGMTARAAVLAARGQNPSDFLAGCGAAVAASWLLAVLAWWAMREQEPSQIRRAPRADYAPTIDWTRLALSLGAPIVLVWLALPVIVPATVTFWLPLVFAFLESPRMRWTAGTMELGFLVVGVPALGCYTRLRRMRRSGLSLPTGRGLGVVFGGLCLLAGIFSLLSPTSALLPALTIVHDRVLTEALRRAVARDDGEAFRAFCAELTRRPEDRGHSLEAASREFRTLAPGPDSLSATLSAYQQAHPRPQYSEGTAWFGLPPRISDPELAFLDVLRQRGDTAEVMNWVVDPRLPLPIRLAVASWWSQRPRVPRAKLFAAVGRACVEAGRANTYPSPFGSWHSSDCPSEIGSMLPHDPTALTRQEGFALMYAALALNPGSVDRVLSRVSPEVALSMLHGLHASELHTPVRRKYLSVGVDCPTLHRLADIACPVGHGEVCLPVHFNHFGLESLQPCIDQLPTAETPEMAEFIGY